jgi:hypothetical protein
MCCFWRILLLLDLAASAVAGGQGLDELRGAARESGRQVDALRAKQASLKRELDELSPRIEARKKEPAVVPGAELKNELRRSQELSSQLTEVAQSLARAEAEWQHRNTELLDGLSTQLGLLEAAWEQSPEREARERLLGRMRALKLEREQLRAAMPVQEVPALGPSPVGSEPEALLRRVDALRDAEDKARRQLQAVEVRIAELRQEQGLEQRMRDFVSEQSLFDDQDRRFRLEPDKGRSPLPSGVVGPAAGGPSASGPASSRSAEKPPQFGDAPQPVADPNNLSALEAQRDRLKKLADQLREQARQLESRAKTVPQP